MYVWWLLKRFQTTVPFAHPLSFTRVHFFLIEHISSLLKNDIQDYSRLYCLLTSVSTTPSRVAGCWIALERILKVWKCALLLSVSSQFRNCTGIDSNMSDNFGRSIMYGLSALTTIVTITVVGGLPFLCVAVVLAYFYFDGKPSGSQNISISEWSDCYRIQLQDTTDKLLVIWGD